MKVKLQSLASYYADNHTVFCSSDKIKIFSEADTEVHEKLLNKEKQQTNIY